MTSWFHRWNLRWRIAAATGAAGSAILAVAVFLFSDSPHAVWIWIGGTTTCIIVARWLVGVFLKPLDRMAEDARRISWESAGPRLGVENPHDESGRLADAFNNVLARLDDAFAETRRFTSDASHELRTPLTAIRSVGEVAATRADATPDELRDAIGQMLDEAARMRRLIDDLLLLTRPTSESTKELEPVRVDVLIGEVVAISDVLAEEKKQSIVVRCDPGLHALALPDALRIALTNLLQNAIRHSPPGAPIHVSARASVLAVTIEVADQGEGIPREHHARIFERFYRADASRARSSGGTGLGLAIAKWCIARCGGEIGLRSHPGSGSTFFVCLKPAMS